MKGCDFMGFLIGIVVGMFIICIIQVLDKIDKL